ncbi:MAG: hypothetical protein ABR555_18945 [Pyrinomonadaceae bacterium]
MRTPKPRGSPITSRRMTGWVSDFGTFRYAVTEPRIDRWVRQFRSSDRDLAARILDCVEFVPNNQISAIYRTALQSLEGWHATASERKGKWRFAPFSTSAGESGDAMLGQFRHANNLKSKSHNSIFVHKSELLTSELGIGDTIVFVDDFSGTGTQVVDAWPEMSEYLPEGPDVHLILAAATETAIVKIEQETSLLVSTGITLGEGDSVFSDSCTQFNSAEKSTLRRYCDRIVPTSAAAYAQDGYLIVFQHSCPNNTLPILHAMKSGWEGLFRRYDP